MENTFFRILITHITLDNLFYYSIIKWNFNNIKTNEIFKEMKWFFIGCWRLYHSSTFSTSTSVYWKSIIPTLDKNTTDMHLIIIILVFVCTYCMFFILEKRISMFLTGSLPCQRNYGIEWKTKNWSKKQKNLWCLHGAATWCAGTEPRGRMDIRAMVLMWIRIASRYCIWLCFSQWKIIKKKRCS